MIPVEIELENFLAYRRPPPLLFEGIHVACLAGPNGSGKSSLLDALTWALWGRSRATSDDALIHQGETEMRVVLTFDQGGRRYRAPWEREAGSWRSLSEAGLRETQKKIDALLRLEYDTFINSAFLVQGRADEFTTRRPAERKQILGKILGLERWEVYEQRARDHLGDTRGAIQRLEGWLAEVDAELARREARERELATAVAAAGEAAAVLEGAESQWAGLEQARSELVGLQRMIDDLTRRITAAEREDAEAEAERQTALAHSRKAALTSARTELAHQAEALAVIQAAAE